MARESAERARDIGGHRRLFGNDQGLAHTTTFALRAPHMAKAVSAAPTTRRILFSG
jgi:hypothetical protein